MGGGGVLSQSYPYLVWSLDAGARLQVLRAVKDQGFDPVGRGFEVKLQA